MKPIDNTKPIAGQLDLAGKTLEERGLPDHSYFEIDFADGSSVSEKDVNWSHFSHQEFVERLGNKHVSFISDLPIKNIRIFHDGLTTEINDIPADIRVAQFARSEWLQAKDIDIKKVVGRGIALIKNHKIIEEHYIDGLSRVIGGFQDKK